MGKRIDPPNRRQARNVAVVEEEGKMFIVFDLDDTLANNAHRHRILNEEAGDIAPWESERIIKLLMELTFRLTTNENTVCLEIVMLEFARTGLDTMLAIG